MGDQLFVRESHARQYARFRFSPPLVITEKILQFMDEKLPPPHEHVVDVGCGTGQSTRIWRNHFQKVTGCDISSAQITVAEEENQDGGISYLLCPAHSIPLPDRSVELVSTVAALHWFDIPKFFQETKRLLKPNGVLAIQSHHKPILLFDTRVKNEVARDLVKKLLAEALANYWSPRIEININEFSDYSFPFDQVVRYSNIRSEFQVTVDDVIGYVTSYSSYQIMKEKEPAKLHCIMQSFEQRLLELAGGKEKLFTFARDAFLILCRDDCNE